MTEPKVAVIGAGLAGLKAATDLAANGVAVVVFDKSRGVGGRMATRRSFPDDFDHGAQYFTARGDAFRKQVDTWASAGVVASWDASLVRLGGDTPDLPDDTTERYVGTPRMTNPAKDLAAPLRVELSCRVTELAQEDGTWTLVSDAGIRHPGFSHVIIATPSPQAVPLLDSSPELQAAARSVRMLACHAMMIRFEHPVKVDFAGAFVAESPLSWVARNRSKPGRPDGEAWVLHTTPAYSLAHVDDAPDSLTEELTDALSHAIGVRLPAIRSSAVHRWLLARAENPLGKSCLFDDAQQLGVCGDWLLGDRLEDAFESGAAMAAHLELTLRVGSEG